MIRQAGQYIGEIELAAIGGGASPLPKNHLLAEFEEQRGGATPTAGSATSKLIISAKPSASRNTSITRTGPLSSMKSSKYSG
ncbi:hypothetical protein [Bradyrhizobium sp. WSM1743]|uniref:hypothetical protein n=1 Tax=Bradyrhizobium sp. WSM1743 TaxID=318996 RepID=UPI0004865B82|nr:hypothetical protein [Bradyrhizobium sp. WSM1743]